MVEHFCMTQNIPAMDIYRQLKLVAVYKNDVMRVQMVQGDQKSASDKNFEILLKNYFPLKNFYNHMLCWNCSPPIA